MLPTTSISEIKREVAGKLSIPVEEQKLLLLGRTLADEQTVQSYPTIKDGTKLNLVVKKPDGLHEASLKYFKKLGMTDKEATNAANRLLKIVQDKFNKLSWDDIDRYPWTAFWTSVVKAAHWLRLSRKTRICMVCDPSGVN